MIEQLGHDKFIWFIGVVEGLDDPKKLGRMRVRIVGHHSENIEDAEGKGIPADKLLWGYPLLPVTSASVSGVGITPTGIVTGSRVVGFFMDSVNMQQPLVMGSIGGIPDKLADSNKGFNDPTGEYPRYINEPDTNRLADQDRFTTHPNYTYRQGNKVTGIEHAFDTVATRIPTSDVSGETWDEPDSVASPQYPKNKVFETESGHIVEFDDTSENERIHISHKTGTYSEINPDGSKNEKIYGKNCTIILDENKVLIYGDNSITIIGDNKLHVKGGMQQEIDGDYQIHVKGNMIRKVDGNDYLDVTGLSSQWYGAGEFITNDANRDELVQGNYVVAVNGATGSTFTANTINQTISGDVVTTVQGNMNLTIEMDYTIDTTGNVTETIGGNKTETATGSHVTNASNIDHNEG